jgi:carbon monoxide dehydrogenase subunit G
MHLEGQFTVNAQPAEVYAFLTDPRKVSGHMPDLINVDIQDDDHFSVTARVGVSHIKGTMVMKLEIRDRQPPIGTTVVGRGSGLASNIDMVTSFRLEHSDGHTVVYWRGDVTISGKLAAFGPHGLLDRLAGRNVDAFIEGIKVGLAAHSGSPGHGMESLTTKQEFDENQHGR